MDWNKITSLSEESRLSFSQKAIWAIISIVADITTIICQKMYNISWVENIPKNKNFLLISNHPWNFDYFPIKQQLQDLEIDISFFVHKNICSHPLVQKFSDENNFLWVRRFDYDNPHKIPWSTQYNISSIRKWITQIKEGWNLWIFISWEGYKQNMDKIFHWYRLIVKKLFSSWESELIILPVVIKGKNVCFLPPINLQEYNPSLLEEIEESMKSHL